MDEAQKEEIGAALERVDRLLWYVANMEGVAASEEEADAHTLTVATLRKIGGDAMDILSSDAFRGIPRDDDDDES